MTDFSLTGGGCNFAAVRLKVTAPPLRHTPPGIPSTKGDLLSTNRRGHSAG
jgi:hypothetical protein